MSRRLNKLFGERRTSTAPAACGTCGSTVLKPLWKDQLRGWNLYYEQCGPCHEARPRREHCEEPYVGSPSDE